jgi:short-subunit dehydrogenase
MMNLNALHAIYLSKALLPWLIKRETRTALLFVSSATATTLFPGTTAYGATKTLESQFGKILAEELKLRSNNNLDVLVYEPYGVTT